MGRQLAERLTSRACLVGWRDYHHSMNVRYVCRYDPIAAYGGGFISQSRLMFNGPIPPANTCMHVFETRMTSMLYVHV